MADVTIEDKLSRNEDVLRSYQAKFEEHKRFLQGQRDLPSFVTREAGNAWDSDQSDEPSFDAGVGGSPRRSVPVYEALIEKGKLYDQKKESAREEALKGEMRTLRAKPRISKFGRQKTYEKPIEERFKDLEDKRQRDLREAREARCTDAPRFTHKPHITRKGRQASGRASSATDALDQWKNKRDQHIHEQKEKQVLEALAECRDVPLINEHSQRIVERKKKDDSGLGRGPHYTHADSLLERDRLSKLHMWEKYQQELVEQQPGNPKITPFAASLERDGDPCLRLYAQSFDREEKNNYLLQKKMISEGSECYHTPRITMNAATIVRYQPVEDDLLERHEVAKSRKEEWMKEVMTQERTLHQPVINPVSDEIASRLCQTARERLYGQKVDYSALQQQYIEQQKSLCESRSVSPAPSRRRRAKSVDYHLKGERSKEMQQKRLDQLRQQQNRQEMAECSFRPQICRAPAEQKNMDFLDRTTQRMKKKDEKLTQARRERDIKEEMDCPFVPNIAYRRGSVSNSVPEDDGNGIYGGDGRAWGFNDFVERHRAARKQAAEKEKGGWSTGKKWKNKVTVPHEFTLGRREEAVRSLQKPLSPPRLTREEYEEAIDAAEHMSGGDPDRDLPQQGLFSQGANAILDYQPPAPGQPGYHSTVPSEDRQPEDARGSYDYGYGPPAAPLQAWSGSYPQHHAQGPPMY